MRYVVGWVLAVVLALAALDGALWYRGGVPITNQAWQVLAGAPAVHVRGQSLVYSGTFPVNDEGIVPLAVSDEGLALYKARGTPDWYAWIFIPRTGGRPAWRYKRPGRS
jgi:hypothetical protein